MARFTQQTWSLEVTQDLIDITSENWSPNEWWRFTDALGHEHRYLHGYPTLDLIVDASHWCDGTEGWMLHDPHKTVDESHYECKICREVIEPAMDPPYTPKKMPGLIDARLSGLRSDGWTIAMWINEAEMALLRGASPDTVNIHAQRLLDEATDDRIMSKTISR